MKFKKGDKVRLTAIQWFCDPTDEDEKTGIYVGSVGTIIGGGYDEFEVRFDDAFRPMYSSDEGWVVYEKYLELVESSTPATTKTIDPAMLKEGDRVRFRDGFGREFNGTFGVNAMGTHLIVRADGYTFGHLVEYIEILEVISSASPEPKPFGESPTVTARIEIEQSTKAKKSPPPKSIALTHADILDDFEGAHWNEDALNTFISLIANTRET